MCALISSLVLLTTIAMAHGSARAQVHGSHAPILAFARSLQWKAMSLRQAKTVTRATSETQSLTRASLLESAAASHLAGVTYSHLSSSVLRFMQPGKDFVEADSPIRSMRAAPMLCHGIGVSLTFAIK
jgi:hypothetical protein